MHRPASQSSNSFFNFLKAGSMTRILLLLSHSLKSAQWKAWPRLSLESSSLTQAQHFELVLPLVLRVMKTCFLLFSCSGLRQSLASCRSSSRKLKSRFFGSLVIKKGARSEKKTKTKHFVSSFGRQSSRTRF